MKIPVGAVSLLDADRGAGGEPVCGVVQSDGPNGTVVTVEKADAVRFEVGSQCQVRYTDPRDGRFKGVCCVVESNEQDRLTLRCITETRSANQRMSYRVNMARLDITACVGPLAKCRVIDISATGIRVHAPESLTIGATVCVQFDGEGQKVRGEFVVRRVSESGGWSQIGLSADPKDKRLTGSLAQLVSAIEREQLRRRSRISGGVAEAAGEEVGDAGQAGAGEACEDGAGETPDQPGEDAWVRVPASVLAGRALPGTLVSEAGSVVVSRGEVLSLDDFRRLGSEGMYATDDWSTEHADRRANRRSMCDCGVRVVALQGREIMKMNAELTDISRGGVALRTPTMLDEDVYLVIDFSNAKGNRWIIGKVVHRGTQEGEARCRLGVQFFMSASQTGPVPESVPEFARWISVKPDKEKRCRVGQ